MCGHVRPVNEKLKQQGFKTHANVLLWLQISAVFRESNSTAELTDVMYVALYIEAEAPEL